MNGEKKCVKCKWLKKYTSEDGVTWMNVCESDDAEWEDDGLYHVTVVDIDEFDASACLNFVAKEQSSTTPNKQKEQPL